MTMVRTLEDMLINRPARPELLSMSAEERIVFFDAEEKQIIGKEKKKRRKKEIDRIVAEHVYHLAKTKFAKEKEQHRIIEEGFVEEKAKHREERERFKIATAKFQRDSYDWRCICREDKAKRMAEEIEEDNRFDEDLERLKERAKGKSTTNVGLAELEFELKKKSSSKAEG